MRRLFASKLLLLRSGRSPLLRAPIVLGLVLFCLAPAHLRAADLRNVELGVGDETVRAFLVQEDSDAGRPGVVVVHGWWGLNDQMRGVTERVAELGYVAIAPDLYAGRLPADLGYAHDFMRDLDEKRAMRILRTAALYLRSMPGAARRPVGMIGFDMGGQLTLTAALRGLPVQTAISFYGDTRNDRDQLEALQIPFLGIYASDDRATPPADVERFESLLKELGKNAEITVMHDVGRYFSNEDRPGYDEEATASAWYLTREFLADNLGGAKNTPGGKGRAFSDERVQKDPRWKRKRPPPK